MTRVADIVTAVRTEGAFDAIDAQVLAWVTARHRKMVVRARCYRKTVSIGPGVAGQREYPLPADLRGILEVDVDGVRYGEGHHSDISADMQGNLWLLGTGGVTTAEEDANGLGMLALIPIPSAGASILVRGFFSPAGLSLTDDTTLKTPDDYDDALIAGGISTGYRRLQARPDLAGSFETDFSNACEELRSDINRRYRPQGPAQIRVVGYNA